MEKISLFLKQFGILIGLGLMGIGILIYGLWGVIVPEKATVEIIKESGNQNTQIVVDVAGAVENPGVYTLPGNSRIGDALVTAGGLSALADREWVALTLNLASQVKDGEKVYIPTRSALNAVNAGTTIKQVAATNGKININTASLSELDGLTGIGEVRAKSILDNRPYSKTDDLVSKAKIPQSVYEKIKDQVAIY